MKTHLIRWKNMLNGRIGTGTLFFEKEEAERLAAELNQDYPDIQHEAVSAIHVEPAATAPAVIPSEEIEHFEQFQAV
jgi:hypothetical protein